VISIHVENCLTIGSNKGIQEVIGDLKRHDFGLKIEEYFEDYLSCHIKIDNKDGISWILQPYLINNLKIKFREEAMVMQNHETPGTPEIKILRPNDEEEISIQVKLNTV
jgi:hypothetical protein